MFFHEAAVTSVEFSHNGRRLLTASEDAVTRQRLAGFVRQIEFQCRPRRGIDCAGRNWRRANRRD